MFDWVYDLIRSLFWSIAKALLGIMDACYFMIRQVAAVDFINESIVWDAWKGIMVLFGFIIAYRVAARLLKALVDEEELEKFNFGSLCIRMGIIMGIVAAFPLLVGTVNLVGNMFVNNVNMFVGVSDDTAPSTIIISNYIASESDDYLTYTLSDISINKKEGPLFQEEYKFFPELSDLMTICILGCSAAVLMIAIALGIAKRLFGLVMLIVISPIPLSSFIFKEGDLSGVWGKQVLGIYTCNFVQIMSLVFVISLSSSESVRSLNILAQLIMMMGGFLFALGGGEFLGRVLGVDSSAGDTLQQISQIAMIGRGLGGAVTGVVATGMATGKGILKSKGGVATGGLATGGSAVTYGIGRMVGGQSIKNLGGAGSVNVSQPLTRSGSVLNRFSNSPLGQSLPGRFMSMTGKHLYAASANRYGSKSAYKMAASAKEKVSNFKNGMNGLKGGEMSGRTI